MWDRLTADMGIIKENTNLSVAFTHSGGINDLTFSASCGCTDVKWDAVSQVLTAHVNVGKFPPHLRAKNVKRIEFLKTISVYYTVDNQKKQDVLVLKAILI